MWNELFGKIWKFTEKNLPWPPLLFHGIDLWKGPILSSSVPYAFQGRALKETAAGLGIISTAPVGGVSVSSLGSLIGKAT